MTYDFDKITDRHGTDAVKTDAMRGVWGRDDLTPLWVADMDFETPPFVVEALKARMEHPVFGYTTEPEDYWPSVTDWIRDRHGWEVRREWLCYIPGIVKGIGMAVNVFTKKGDKVIIQPPVYHPFRLVPEGNGREVVMNPLIRREDGYYDMDFDNLAEVADEQCRMLILSNPHNPAGLCWDRETLRRLAHFCKEHGIVVVSDEAAHCSITFSAPSKTFNIAGIVSSWAVVPDDDIRRQFYGWIRANEMEAPPLFSPIATMAALRHGEEWRQQMLRYVEANIDYVVDFCHDHIPGIRPLRPQASFLVWLDCRGLGLSHDALNDLFVNKARLALNDGAMFGPGGEGFMRLNVGCPRAILEDALERLRQVI